MKRPKIVCGWGSSPEPAAGAYDAPPGLLVGWGRGHPFPISLPSKSLTAVVGRLQGHEGKMDTPSQFVKCGCALGTDNKQASAVSD